MRSVAAFAVLVIAASASEVVPEPAICAFTDDFPVCRGLTESKDEYMKRRKQIEVEGFCAEKRSHYGPQIIEKLWPQCTQQNEGE